VVNLWDRHVASRDRGDNNDAEDTANVPFGGGDRSLAGRWEAWEGKGSLLLHADLVSDILVHSMTLAHYMHIWYVVRP
jgi:hypothetical protein